MANININDHMDYNILDYCKLLVDHYKKAFYYDECFHHFNAIAIWENAYNYYEKNCPDATVEEAIKKTDNHIIQLTHEQIRDSGIEYLKQGYSPNGFERIRERYGF